MELTFRSKSNIQGCMMTCIGTSAFSLQQRNWLFNRGSDPIDTATLITILYGSVENKLPNAKFHLGQLLWCRAQPIPRMVVGIRKGKDRPAQYEVIKLLLGPDLSKSVTFELCWEYQLSTIKGGKPVKYKTNVPHTRWEQF